MITRVQSQQNAGTCCEIANRCLRAHVTLSQHLESVEITEKLLKSIRQFEVYVLLCISYSLLSSEC